METYWQEILTFVIVGIAVYLLLKRYFFRKSKSKGVGADECEPCSIGSCDGCAVLELKEQIGKKNQSADFITFSEQRSDSQGGDSVVEVVAEESEEVDTIQDKSSGETAESSYDSGSDGNGTQPIKKDYLSQCLDGCIQARRMGLK